jgi:hypothetical protein
MAGLAAIETSYKGYRFRSRLEARWAVFFQALRLKWDYEPEGFTLPSGRHYLPDFRIELPWERKRFWCEVKPPDGDICLFEEFMQAAPVPVIGTILREIPDPTGDFDTWSSGVELGFFPLYLSEPCIPRPPIDEQTRGPCDIAYQFCVCRSCLMIGFQFEGRSHRINCACTKCGDRGHSADHEMLLNAYAAARAARFEHGEAG